MTRRVVVNVDYVHVDDVNYDQTTKLNHTILADQMTPVRIIGSTLSRKIASNFLRILFIYLSQIALQIAESSFAEGFSEPAWSRNLVSMGSLSRRERGCYHSQYTIKACNFDIYSSIYKMPMKQCNGLGFQCNLQIFVRNQWRLIKKKLLCIICNCMSGSFFAITDVSFHYFSNINDNFSFKQLFCRIPSYN